METIDPTKMMCASIAASIYSYIDALNPEFYEKREQITNNLIEFTIDGKPAKEKQVVKYINNMRHNKRFIRCHFTDDLLFHVFCGEINLGIAKNIADAKTDVSVFGTDLKVAKPIADAWFFAICLRVLTVFNKCMFSGLSMDKARNSMEKFLISVWGFEFLYSDFEMVLTTCFYMLYRYVPRLLESPIHIELNAVYDRVQNSLDDQYGIDALKAYINIQHEKLNLVLSGSFVAIVCLFSNRLHDDFDDYIESTMLPDDDWYADQPLPSYEKKEETIRIIDTQKPQEKVTEPDPEPIKVVQVLPNKEKLVRVRDHEGKIKYIVIGEDIDVQRLPKIYKLMRNELKMGRNVTTDRLTRILKLDTFLTEGWTKREAAELMDVPLHIVRSDSYILNEINELNKETTITMEV